MNQHRLHSKALYAEKLRDPRWQKMRLLVMDRDKFTCIDCGSTQDTLNVHHKYYVFSRDPWEYPMNTFATLCENCHLARGKAVGPYNLFKGLVDEMLTFGVDPDDADGVAILLFEAFHGRRKSLFDVEVLFEKLGRFHGGVIG